MRVRTVWLGMAGCRAVTRLPESLLDKNCWRTPAGLAPFASSGAQTASHYICSTNLLSLLGGGYHRVPVGRPQHRPLCPAQGHSGRRERSRLCGSRRCSFDVGNAADGPGRLVAFGETEDGRVLAAYLDTPVGGRSYPATVRPMSANEERSYRRARGAKRG